MGQCSTFLFDLVWMVQTTASLSMGSTTRQRVVLVGKESDQLTDMLGDAYVEDATG